MGRDRADDRSPGRCEEDAPFWSSPPSPGRAMSPASVGAYIAAAPTAFQKRAPFADPATRSRPIDDRERGPSLFVYARFAYGRNRLLRVASALASREARVSRCADRQRKATELFGGKSEQNFHKIFTLRQTIVIELPFYIPLLSVRIRVVLYVYLVRCANRNTPIYFTHSNQVSV